MPAPLKTSEDPLAFLRKTTDIVVEPVLEDDDNNKKPDDTKKAEDAKRKLEEEEKRKEPVAALRKKKDELEKKNTELQKQLDELKCLGDLKPLSVVADYLKKKNDGKIDDDVVNKFIEDQKKRKKDLEEKDKQIKLKDGAINEFEITATDTWKQDFQKPLFDAHDSLIATVSNVDKEGNIKHPELVNSLVKALITGKQDGSNYTTVEIKGIIQRFQSDYEDKTKEEYDVPRINEVVDYVNQVRSLSTKAENARSNWKKTIEEKKKERIFEESKEQEILSKKERDGREYQFKKAVLNFDLKSVDGIFDEDEIKEFAESSHNEFTEIFEGKKNQLSYQDIVTNMSKSKGYDVLIDKYKELKSEFEKYKKINNSGLSRESKEREVKKEGEQSEVKPDGFDPLSALREASRRL